MAIYSPTHSFRVSGKGIRMRDIKPLRMGMFGNEFLAEVDLYENDVSTGLMLCTERGSGTSTWMPRHVVMVVLEKSV